MLSVAHREHPSRPQSPSRRTLGLRYRSEAERCLVRSRRYRVFRLAPPRRGASSLDLPVCTAAHESLGREDRDFRCIRVRHAGIQSFDVRALKNTTDYLFREWNDKAAGFVGYGGMTGARAVEQLRLIMGEIKIADVRAQVGLSLFTNFENFSTFKPAPHQEATVTAMLDDLVSWGRALQAMRVQRSERL